jgi:septal ring factor EnvC (AmiA/AmiB activator)
MDPWMCLRGNKLINIHNIFQTNKQKLKIDFLITLSLSNLNSNINVVLFSKPSDPNNSLAKELCEKRVELAKVDEKRNALQAQVDSQKAECSEKLAALKTHNEQITYARTTFHDRVKTILQDNCDLR